MTGIEWICVDDSGQEPLYMLCRDNQLIGIGVSREEGEQILAEHDDPTPA